MTTNPKETTMTQPTENPTTAALTGIGHHLDRLANAGEQTNQLLGELVQLLREDDGPQFDEADDLHNGTDDHPDDATTIQIPKITDERLGYRPYGRDGDAA